MDPALEKLRQAVEEYLAAGGDTPVAAEAQALMQAIDSSGDPAGQGPTGMGDQADQMGQPSPMDMGPEQGLPAPQPGAKTFGQARGGAQARLEQLNKKKVKA